MNLQEAAIKYNRPKVNEADTPEDYFKSWDDDKMKTAWEEANSKDAKGSYIGAIIYFLEKEMKKRGLSTKE